MNAAERMQQIAEENETYDAQEAKKAAACIASGERYIYTPTGNSFFDECPPFYYCDARKCSKHATLVSRSHAHDGAPVKNLYLKEDSWEEFVTAKSSSTKPAISDEPTEKQISFFSSLYMEKMENIRVNHTIEDFVESMKETGTWTKKGMSAMIDNLVKMKKTAPAASTQTAAKAPSGSPNIGMHLADGTVYKVQSSATGNTYAKRLEGSGWIYEGKKPFRFLSADTEMTKEEAAAYGKIHGVCCVCGAHLTDEKSIAAGIGPICEGRF